MECPRIPLLNRFVRLLFAFTIMMSVPAQADLIPGFNIGYTSSSYSTDGYEMSIIHSGSTSVAFSTSSPLAIQNVNSSAAGTIPLCCVGDYTTDSASTSVSMMATYGFMQVDTSASAFATDVRTSNDVSGGTASVELAAWDALTAYDPSLPAGAAISVQLTAELTANWTVSTWTADSCPYWPTISTSIVYLAPGFQTWPPCANRDFQWTQTATFNLPNGRAQDELVDLTAIVGAGAGAYGGSSSVSFQGSIAWSYQVLDRNATLTAASGASYSAIPEPSTLVLILSGIGISLWLRRHALRA